MSAAAISHDNPQMKPANQVSLFSVAIVAALVPPLTQILCFSQASPLAPKILQSLAAVPAISENEYGTVYVHVVLNFVAAISVVAFYIYDHGYAERPRVRWAVWWTVLAIVAVATILSVPHHPCFTAAILAGMSAVALYAVRMLVFCDVDSDAWFQVAWVALACAAVTCLAVGIVWMSISFMNAPEDWSWTDWTEPMKKLVKSREITWKMAFVSWAIPGAIAVELCFLSFLCWIRKQHSSLPQPAEPRQSIRDFECTPKDMYIVKTMRQITLWLLAATIILWVAAAIQATGKHESGQEREDMRDEVLAMAFWSFILLAIWAVETLGPGDIVHAVKMSKVMQETMNVWESDWPKAIVLLIGAPIMACCAVYDFIHAIWKRRTTSEQPSTDGVDDSTDDAKPLLWFTYGWSWTSVVVKAIWLGLAYVVFVIAVRFTTVTLAIANEQLAGWSLFSVSIIMFLLALILILIPFTPGPPVYMIMGIVIVASAMRQGWTFWAGVAWAIFVAFAMRIAFTALAQKLIGETFASSDYIRQAVQIHTVYMRTIEAIMKEPEVTTAKVAMLVGGPDCWPITVLCGMLRIPVMQIILATSPVLVQSIGPLVCAGALMLRHHEGHGTAVELALLLCAILQLVAGIVAFYYVQDVMERDYEELTTVRPQDAELIELDRKVEARDRVWKRVNAWEELPFVVKEILIVGFLCMEVSVWSLSLPWHYLFGEDGHCFRKFGLMSSVEKDLQGDIFRLVLPLGWTAMALGTAGALCQGLFYFCLRSDEDLVEEETKALMSKT
eukprot:gnl/TRDRNA2_/TRDRNA2_161060_c0_seq10.p1 gnl/TRDRNA2_/TRDRNA2_161060_c0~~gnl/TRDRNA2_/TRDRNA2_161060_c0_seq10.p1  ORF type:complete len:784 (+),score=90.47 gnl/TRDRNA2_/TRDRNA2_161060_c0_seq10:64-2415(+)